MAQKELRKKAAKADDLGRVPKKAGFLGQIEMELVQAGYENVGNVVGGSLNINRGPLKVGLGAGGEKLEYFEDSQFYLAPKLEVRGILGDFELYAVGNAAMTLKGTHKKTMLGTYAAVGAVWEAVPKTNGNGFHLRIGSEFEYTGQWIRSEGLSPVDGVDIARFGGAVGYDAITAYAIEDVVYAPKKAYGGMTLIESAGAHHHKMRAGIVVNKSGISVGGEFFQTPFGKGGELSFESRRISPKLSAWYSQEGEMWGGETKLGLLLTMPLRFGDKRYGREHPVWRTGNPMAKDAKKGWATITSNSGEEAEVFFREALSASEDIAELGYKYRGKTGTEVLFAAALLGEYGLENYEKVGDKSLKKLGVEGSYDAAREFLKRNDMKEKIKAFLDTSSPYVPLKENTAALAAYYELPAYIRQNRKLWKKKYWEVMEYIRSEYIRLDNLLPGGAGVCRNINPMQATFLREAGWDAFSIGLLTEKGPHIFTLGRDPKTGETSLLNYGNVLTSKRGQVWPLIRQYAKNKGIALSGVEIWGEGNEFIGYYELEEGKLNRAKAGKGETLKGALLHSRPRKK
ncbi:hypothetical protein JW721_01920 [Candidatus Micrarchaeota archaeon]|nr:hypothetical protein [Candidatus Micrarchaeota archaeon]